MSSESASRCQEMKVIKELTWPKIRKNPDTPGSRKRLFISNVELVSLPRSLQRAQSALKGEETTDMESVNRGGNQEVVSLASSQVALRGQNYFPYLIREPVFRLPGGYTR